MNGLLLKFPYTIDLTGNYSFLIVSARPKVQILTLLLTL